MVTAVRQCCQFDLHAETQAEQRKTTAHTENDQFSSAQFHLWVIKSINKKKQDMLEI